MGLRIVSFGLYPVRCVSYPHIGQSVPVSFAEMEAPAALALKDTTGTANPASTSIAVTAQMHIADRQRNPLSLLQ